jgi:transposase-like protein
MRSHHFLSLAEIIDAAKSETFHWTPQRKAVVVEAVAAGQLTGAEIARRFAVSAEELASWRGKIGADGVPALRATRLQIYEPQRPKGDRPSAPSRTQVAAGAFR